MWQLISGSVLGYACHTQCSNLPCRAKLGEFGGGKPFKLSLTVHHALFDDLRSFQRPFVCVKYGDEERTKETELADWDKGQSAWAWRETLTVEVSPSNDITVSILSKAKYDLWLASLSLTSKRVGDVKFQVASILPKLRMEDRDSDGMGYFSPPISFDVNEGGRSVGKVFISFGTKTAPANLRKESAEQGWCAIAGPGSFGEGIMALTTPRSDYGDEESEAPLSYRPPAALRAVL